MENEVGKRSAVECMTSYRALCKAVSSPEKGSLTLAPCAAEQSRAARGQAAPLRLRACREGAQHGPRSEGVKGHMVHLEQIDKSVSPIESIRRCAAVHSFNQNERVWAEQVV